MERLRAVAKSCQMRGCEAAVENEPRGERKYAFCGRRGVTALRQNRRKRWSGKSGRRAITRKMDCERLRKWRNKRNYAEKDTLSTAYK